MSVVSVRVPDDVEAYFRSKGIAPGVLARDLLEKEARRQRLQEVRSNLEKFARPASKPVVDIIREIRDEH